VGLAARGDLRDARLGGWGGNGEVGGSDIAEQVIEWGHTHQCRAHSSLPRRTHQWRGLCRTHVDADQGESAESAGESDGEDGVVKKSKAVDRNSKLTKSQRNKQALKKERAREHTVASAAKTMRKEVRRTPGPPRGRQSAHALLGVTLMLRH
jgi:sRNA-binding protein